MYTDSTTDRARLAGLSSGSLASQLSNSSTGLFCQEVDEIPPPNPLENPFSPAHQPLPALLSSTPAGLSPMTHRGTRQTDLGLGSGRRQLDAAAAAAAAALSWQQDLSVEL